MEVEDLSVEDFARNRRVNAEAIRTITEGLSAYNQKMRPDPDAAPLTLVVRHDGAVLGGVLGRMAWRWLRVDTVWIDESLRGKGMGRALLDRAESAARAHGCIGMHLDTHGFQAPGFYERLGFERFGAIPDYPDVASGYYVKRFLIEGSD